MYLSILSSEAEVEAEQLALVLLVVVVVVFEDVEAARSLGNWLKTTVLVFSVSVSLNSTCDLLGRRWR